MLALGSLLITACANPLANNSFKSGEGKYEQGDYQGAIADWSRAIEINPRHAGTYFYRGNAKHDLKDYHGAIDDYNKVIEIDPQFAVAYYNRGIAKGNLDDMRGACADWIKSASLGDDDAAEFVKMDCK